MDIINSNGDKVLDFYNSNKVTNPQTKTWDGKDGLGTVVSDGVYTIKILFTDMAGNSVTDTSKTITVSTAQ